MATVHQLVIPANGTERQAARRRVLMRAALRMRGSDTSHAVAVKDISSTGLRASSAVSMLKGARVEVDLPNIGWTPASLQMPAT